MIKNSSAFEKLKILEWCINLLIHHTPNNMKNGTQENTDGTVWMYLFIRQSNYSFALLRFQKPGQGIRQDKRRVFHQKTL